jgi:hypothetical protein
MADAATTIDKAELPTSFGAFKPVGHLMLGFPKRHTMLAARQTLAAAGWPEDELVIFTPRESLAEMHSLIENASGLAGFGSEITMMRRYAKLAEQGYCWLLVRAPDEADARRAAELAEVAGATLGVHYRSLVVEDMITVEGAP